MEKLKAYTMQDLINAVKDYEVHSQVLKATQQELAAKKKHVSQLENEVAELEKKAHASINICKKVAKDLE